MEPRAGRGGGSVGRVRWKTLAAAAAVALSLLLVWRVGAYLMGRGVLEKELLADIRAEWASLEEEERSLPEGTNAAEVWEEAARVLPPSLWCRVQVEDRGDVDGMLAKCEPGLVLVDRALAMEECLFPVKKPRSALGPFRVMPLGPAVQSDLIFRIPSVLVVRARKALAEGRLADAREDARRILRCAEQATGRWYAGPSTWGETVRLAATLMEEILGRPDLPAGEARLLAGFPGSAVFHRGRENQLRLHRLHADIDLLSLVSGNLGADRADEVRRELDLPRALPLVGVSLSDVDAVRAFRSRAARPLRRGLESWPEAGPPAALGRLDLLRAAAALRAFQVEKGRPASRLENLVPDFLASIPLDPWSAAPLPYAPMGDGWSLRISPGKVPTGVFLDGRWEEQEVDLSFRWPPRPVPESAWRPGGM